MSPASNDAHKEMNETKGVRIRLLRGQLDLSDDTKSFLTIGRQNPMKVLNYILGIVGVYTSL